MAIKPLQYAGRVQTSLSGRLQLFVWQRVPDGSKRKRSPTQALYRARLFSGVQRTERGGRHPCASALPRPLKHHYEVCSIRSRVARISQGTFAGWNVDHRQPSFSRCLVVRFPGTSYIAALKNCRSLVTARVFNHAIAGLRVLVALHRCTVASGS